MTFKNMVDAIRKLGIWRALIREEDYGRVIITVPRNKKAPMQALRDHIPINIDLKIKEFDISPPKFWKKKEYRTEKATQFEVTEGVINL